MTEETNSKCGEFAAAVRRHGGQTHHLDNDGALLMIVDDEPQVVAINKSLLVARDYRLITFDHPASAFEAYCEIGELVDAVLLDYAMPGMNGHELFQRLKASNPELKAVLISGYADHRSIDEMFDEGLRAFLAKPYTPEQLYEKVAETLAH